MAKRKNKKSAKVSENCKQPVTNKDIDENAATGKEVGKTRKTITIPVFSAGMFLSLILGICLGTLFPEIIQPGKSQVMDNNNSSAPKITENRTAEASTPQHAESGDDAALPPVLAEQARKLKSLIKKDPASAKTWAQLGDIYFDAQMPGQSIDAYSHALALEPANPNVLTDMGVMYREIGNYQKAVECFRMANNINPDHAESLYNEGLVLSNDLHDNAGAKAAWNRLLKIRPDAVSPHGQKVSQMIEELK